MLDAIRRGTREWVCPQTRRAGFLSTATPHDINAWTTFGLAAQQAATAEGFPKAIAAQLTAAMGELHSNIYEHAQEPQSGIVAFRASPVWVLAALADVCGMGRHLIPEIADALKAQGLLDEDTQFTSVEQMLDGLERTSGRLAATVNTPPLDVAALRSEWQAIREAARGLQPASIPSRDTIAGIWTRLKGVASQQDRSIFEASSTMAVSAARSLPDNVRWVSASARAGASRTGQVLAAALLDHYKQTLDELQQVGYATYAARQLRPYVRAAAAQLSPEKRTLTERLLEKL